MPTKPDHHTKILILEIAVVLAIIIAAFGIGFSYNLLYKGFVLKSELNQSIHNSSALASQVQSLKSYAISYNTLNASYSSLQNNYGSLLNKTTTPTIIDLASHKSVLVGNRTLSVPFYNSNYNLYNNYTISGSYFINFTAPTDGYLLLYLYSSSGENGTYGFASGSNSSRYFYFNRVNSPTYTVCSVYLGCQEPTVFDAVAGYEETPNTTDALYVLPVLRGQAYFEIQNSNAYPISVTFSLRYVGENFADIPIDKNYT